MTKLLTVLFGGTFDPVHNGHLGVAKKVLADLPVETIRFIPCHVPVHRNTPGARAHERLDMLKLATKDEARFVVDDIEMQRRTPSYTINTVMEIKKQCPEKILAWIVGYDAWAQFHTWHRAREILNYVHLIVVHRPHVNLSEHAMQHELMQTRCVKIPEDLLQTDAGRIFLLADCDFDISATSIREALNSALTKAPDAPTTVLDYIRQHQLYC